MNREELLKHINLALDVAKDDLLKRGKVLPLLVMIFPDKPAIIAPVPDKKIIPLILKREQPDAFTYVAEAWVKDSEAGEKRDAIQVIGGSGQMRIIATLDFRKKDSIVFDRVTLLSESDLAHSVVDRGLRDEVTGAILGLWSPAPPGGRVYHVARSGFEIWVPEGWRIGVEPEPKEPGGVRTTWWRIRDPHGAIRVTRYYRTPSAGVSDPFPQARSAAKEIEASAAKNVQVEKYPEYAVLSWNQPVQVPNGPKLKAHLWRRYEKGGMAFVSFSYEEGIPPSEIEDELRSMSEIVKRIVLL